MTPLHRLVLFMLLLIVSGNIFLYTFFSGRIREISSDKIVQKAYVVSRLISDAAGVALSARQPAIMRSAVEESLKDRHLVAVVVKGKTGEILLETSNADIPGKHSKFETPILVNGKLLGTVITSFSFDGEDSRLASGLAMTAAIQAGLFAVMAALVIITFRTARRGKNISSPLLQRNGSFTAQVRRSGVIIPQAAPVATASPSLPAEPFLLTWQPLAATVPGGQTRVPVPPLDPFHLPDCRLAPLHRFLQIKTDNSPTLADSSAADEIDLPPGLAAVVGQAVSHHPIFGAAYEAFEALREALDIIAAQSRQSRKVAMQTLLSRQQAATWSRACVTATDRTGTLITAGMDIVAMIQRECSLADATEKANTLAVLAEKLRLEAAALHSSPGQPDKKAIAPLDDPGQKDPGGEAGLFRDVAQSLLHDALPDLLAARTASETSAGIMAALENLMSGLASHTNALLAGCEDLYESAMLADEEETCSHNDCTAITTDSAASLRALAEAHGNRILTLGELVRQAGVLRSSLSREIHCSTLLFRRAGSAVEDAATAALQGSSIISRHNLTAERQAAVIARAAGMMNGLATELEGLPHLLGKPGDAVATIAIAAETVQMAATLLQEIVQLNHGAAMLGEFPLSETPETLETIAEQETTAEQLIRQAQVSIGHLLLQLPAR